MVVSPAGDGIGIFYYRRQGDTSQPGVLLTGATHVAPLSSRTEHLDHIAIGKSKGREMDAPRGTVARQHRVASVTGRPGRQRAAVGPGCAAISRAGMS